MLDRGDLPILVAGDPLSGWAVVARLDRPALFVVRRPKLGWSRRRVRQDPLITRTSPLIDSSGRHNVEHIGGLLEFLLKASGHLAVSDAWDEMEAIEGRRVANRERQVAGERHAGQRVMVKRLGPTRGD
jgi:hypothetical protein